MKYSKIIIVLILSAMFVNAKAQTRQETIEWMSEKLNAYAKLSPCPIRYLSDNTVTVRNGTIRVTYNTGDATALVNTEYELSLSLYDVIGYELPNYGCSSHSVVLKTYGNKITVSWKKERTYYDNDGNAQSDKTNGEYKTASLELSTDGFSEPDLVSRFAKALRNLVAANKQDVPQEKY